MKQLPDSFSIATEPRAVAAGLIERVDTFAHLAQARLLCLFSEPAVTLHGAVCNACIVQPSVQGPLSKFFTWVLAKTAADALDWEEPDFIILFDAAVWRTLDAIRRERLVYHELRHIVARENEYGVPKLDQEGRPMLKLVPHDAEFFFDEVEVYGVEVCGLEDACVSIAEGVRQDRRRKSKVA